MKFPKPPRAVLQRPPPAHYEYDAEAARSTSSPPLSPPCSQSIEVGSNISFEDRGSQLPPDEKLPAESHSRENEGQKDGDSSDKITLKHPQRLKKHREKHQDRSEKLKEILEPILGSENGDSCVLLLCCGSPLACRVLPVPIPISTIATDYVGQWSLIKDSWNTFHRSWRHRLPFYGVKQVSLASVSLLAQAGSSSSNRFGDGRSQFLGACTPEDLEVQMQQQQTIIDQAPDRIFTCYYNQRDAIFQHHQECDDYREAHDMVFEPYESSYECPFENIREAKRRLLQLSRRRSFLTLAFHRPEVSEANDLIPKNRFYSHLEVLRLFDEWGCPSLYELPFRGLIVEEGWLLSSQSVFLVYIGGIFMLAMPLRFIFGGWDAAWGAASCLLTLAMFGYQYTKDQGGHKAACI